MSAGGENVILGVPCGKEVYMMSEFQDGYAGAQSCLFFSISSAFIQRIENNRYMT